jgi:hypothetical protein
MYAPRKLTAVLVLLLVASAAIPAWAQDRDGRRVEASGVIVSIASHERAFVIREGRPGDDRFWLVYVVPGTRVEFGGWRRDDDDDDGRDLLHIGGGLAPLRIGHVVRVEGRLVEHRRIIAREITVLNRIRRGQPFPRPPIWFPARPPEIFFPQNGSVLSSSQFVVVGRTAPRATVRVDVTTTWGFAPVRVGSATVTADEDGIFVAMVRPDRRLPDGNYRITIRASAAGRTFPSTSLTVRLR